tara:strand:- start:1200 stop:1559 length:360 start_codon:yes stop_codon:yes gene_type:complete
MKTKKKYQKGGKKVDGTTNRKGSTKGVIGDTRWIGQSHGGYNNAGLFQQMLNKFNQNTLVGKALKKASPEKIAQRKADKAAAKKAGMSVFNYKKSKKVTKKKLGGFRDTFLEPGIESID